MRGRDRQRKMSLSQQRKYSRFSEKSVDDAGISFRPPDGVRTQTKERLK